MLITVPDSGLPAVRTEAKLPGCPWTLRLAGASHGCPAVEIHEYGVLIDVVTATPIARLVLRGARAGLSAAGPCAIAWGRVPSAGGPPAVEFRGRGWRGPAVPASPFLPADWLWIALAGGRVSAVTVFADGAVYRCRVKSRGGRP